MKKFSVVACLYAVPSIVLAHHGAASQFDTSVEISYTGVVTELALLNPHSYVYFDMTDEQGNYVLDADGENINVSCEMLGWTALRRAGWTTEMFSAGTAIKVGGNPSRLEEHVCVLETMVLDDGPPMTRFTQIEETQPKADLDRPARTSWGDPYIGGDWGGAARTARPPEALDAGGMAGMRAMGGMGDSGIELTEAGQAALEVLEAKIASGEVENNRLNCRPRDFFQDWTFNWIPNRIVQAQDRIEVTYGFMDRPRTIHMDMAAHPDDLEPTLSGHSIGRWDGNVLVVDTVGFTENFRFQRNSVSFINSEQYHTVERFAVDSEAGSLTREYEADDPLYWTAGSRRTGQDVVTVSNLPWGPYNCNDITVE